MRVLEEDIGARRASVFAEFDEEPIGVASIGEVYRATLRDGSGSRSRSSTRGSRQRSAPT